MSIAINANLKDHFIPHAGNGHVPHVLKHHVLFGYGLIAVLLKVAIVAIPIALPSSSAYSSSLTPANVVSLTNDTRHALGLARLEPNELLASAAAAKANDMLANGYFAHTSPTGLTGFALIKQTGYRYQFAGENLAVHYDSAEGVTQGWLASPTHKANIVNPRFTEIGVGVAQGTYDNYPSTMVVQLFAEPAAALSKGESPAMPVAVTAPNDARPPIALVGTTPKDVYGFAAAPTPEVKVLGVSVGDLSDDARRFYLYAVLFLLGAAALSVLAKYHRRQLPHLMHAAFIATLGIGLMR